MPECASRPKEAALGAHSQMLEDICNYLKQKMEAYRIESSESGSTSSGWQMPTLGIRRRVARCAAKTSLQKVLATVTESFSVEALNMCKSVLEELTIQDTTRKGYLQ